MIKYITIVIAVCIAAYVLGVVVALFRMCRAHRTLSARNRGLEQRVNAALLRATRIDTNRRK